MLNCNHTAFSATKTFWFAQLFLALLFCSGQLSAESLPKPTGRVILTITGEIVNTNAPDKAEFDYEMLKEFGLVSMNIETMWTPDGELFEGILTRKLLDIVGASGESITATAANDYAITIPLSDLTEHDTLLAMSKNGVRMRLRDKGPIWLLYSNTDRPKLAEAELNSRMIWQLTTLTVE